MDVGPGILWTAMPLDLVVDGLVEQGASPLEMMVEGRLVQVLPDGDGTGVVERLISTNPQDYLDPRWQPGARISLRPIVV